MLMTSVVVGVRSAVGVRFAIFFVNDSEFTDQVLQKASLSFSDSCSSSSGDAQTKDLYLAVCVFLQRAVRVRRVVRFSSACSWSLTAAQLYVGCVRAAMY